MIVSYLQGDYPNYGFGGLYFPFAPKSIVLSESLTGDTFLFNAAVPCALDDFLTPEGQLNTSEIILSTADKWSWPVDGQ